MANGALQGGLGAGSGALAGFAVGGPVGALAGGLIGGLAGAFGGGSAPGGGLSKGDIEFLLSQRDREIKAFRGRLADVRARSAQFIETSRIRAEERFRERSIPNIEAQFAGRGLQVTGGAFQSELAKRLADIEFQNQQAQAALLQQERGDVLAEQGLRPSPTDIGGLFAATRTAGTTGIGAGLGQLAGQIGGIGLQDILARRRLRDQPRSPISTSGQLPSNVVEIDLTGNQLLQG